MSNSIENIKRTFQTYINNNISANCLIPDDWLHQCAEYILQEFPVCFNLFQIINYLYLYLYL